MITNNLTLPLKVEKKDNGSSDLVKQFSFHMKRTESIFELIIVACQRHRQLNNGARPRIEIPSLKTKNTRIAIEEVNQGLIVYHSNR
jgi:DNA-directed RNA polymerase omega subunit